MKTGIELIQEERQRQIDVEGWTAEHDSHHTNGELAAAAICYWTPEEKRVYQTVSFFDGDENYAPVEWPWEDIWWKPSPDDRIKELKKAGALYMADEAVTGNDWSEAIEKIAKEIAPFAKKYDDKSPSRRNELAYRDWKAEQKRLHDLDERDRKLKEREDEAQRFRETGSRVPRDKSVDEKFKEARSGVI